MNSQNIIEISDKNDRNEYANFMHAPILSLILNIVQAMYMINFWKRAFELEILVWIHNLSSSNSNFDIINEYVIHFEAT